MTASITLRQPECGAKTASPASLEGLLSRLPDSPSLVGLDTRLTDTPASASAVDVLPSVGTVVEEGSRNEDILAGSCWLGAAETVLVWCCWGCGAAMPMSTASSPSR